MFHNINFRKFVSLVTSLASLVLVVSQGILSNTTECTFRYECGPNVASIGVFLVFVSILSFYFRKVPEKQYKWWFLTTCFLMFGVLVYASLHISDRTHYNGGSSGLGDTLIPLLYLGMSVIGMKWALKKTYKSNISVPAPYPVNVEKTTPPPVLNKKIILAYSFSLTVLLFSLSYAFSHLASCKFGLGTPCSNFTEQYFGFIVGALIFAPMVLTFSILTLFARNEIYNAWLRFSLFFIPISGALMLVTPSNDASSGWIMSSPSTSGMVALFAYTLYPLLSVIVILRKFIAGLDSVRVNSIYKVSTFVLLVTFIAALISDLFKFVVLCPSILDQAHVLCVFRFTGEVGTVFLWVLVVPIFGLAYLLSERVFKGWVNFSIAFAAFATIIYLATLPDTVVRMVIGFVFGLPLYVFYSTFPFGDLFLDWMEKVPSMTGFGVGMWFLYIFLSLIAISILCIRHYKDIKRIIAGIFLIIILVTPFTLMAVWFPH